MDFALPAFLSSFNGAVELNVQLLPSRLHAVSSTCNPVYVAASLEWQLTSKLCVIRQFQLTLAIKRRGIFLVPTGNERLSFQLHKAKPGLPVLLRLLLLILIILLEFSTVRNLLFLLSNIFSFFRG